MGGVYQSEYLVTEEVARNWWKAIPPNVTVSPMTAPDTNRIQVQTPGAVWFARSDDDSKSEIFVVAEPSKEQPPKWNMQIHWRSDISRKTTALCIEKALLAAGAEILLCPVSEQ